MKTTTRGISFGIRMGLTLVTLMALPAFAQDQLPQTTKERIRGTPTVSTRTIHGTVVQTDGNDLLVRLTNGQLQEFNVPEIRKFMIDGKEVTVHDLKPGTKLAATETITNTPITERTTTIGTGKVWYVSGNTVIVTLPNHENRMYTVNDNYKFTVDGREAGVHDLRKGMTISAQKIVEAPHTEIASDVVVTGTAPPPPAPKKTEVAAQIPPPRREAPPAPAPRPAEPAAAPAPAPVQQAAAEPAPTLPKTASPVPLAGLLGLCFTSTSLMLRKLRGL